MNGCGSFQLGYVGVGFGGNCDCRYGILYAPMLGGGFSGFGKGKFHPRRSHEVSEGEEIYSSTLF